MSISLAEGTGPKREINITPYIDILLVLLIIFMVITPQKHHDLKVRPPQSPSKNVSSIPNPEVIVVSVYPDSTIEINTKRVSLSQLGNELYQVYSGRPNKNLFIRGATELPYGQIVKIIDIAKGSGVGEIGLLALESPGS